MFRNNKAFSSFSVDDLAKAREFYGKLLDIDVREDKEMPLMRLNLATGGESAGVRQGR